MRNEKTTLAVIAVLAAAYQRSDFNEQATAVWVEALDDLDPGALQIAVKKLIATAKFCPSIAEIRQAALHAVSSIGERSADEAWGDVLNAISTYGWAKPPQFDDPLVERALQCTIGWYDLCTSNIEDGPSHRARFIAAYESLHRRAVEGRLLPDSLRQEIANCRKDFIAGTLGGSSPQDYISDQAQRARALLNGVGDE